MVLHALDLVHVPLSEFVLDLLHVPEHVGPVWLEDVHELRPDVLLRVLREELQKLMVNQEDLNRGRIRNLGVKIA